MKRVMIIGATDGLGAALAHHYAEEGWSLGLWGRSEEKLTGLLNDLSGMMNPTQTAHTVCQDLLELEKIDAALERLFDEMGGAEVFIYNAGVMPTEETTADLQTLFTVNTTAAAALIHRATEKFVEVGAGTIVGVGSIAGDRGRSGRPAYCASKAALHAVLSGLRRRTHGSGVSIVTLKPGFIRTSMLPEEAHSSPLAVSAEHAAKVSAKAIEKRRSVAYVPGWWWFISLVL